MSAQELVDLGADDLEELRGDELRLLDALQHLLGLAVIVERVEDAAVEAVDVLAVDAHVLAQVEHDVQIVEHVLGQLALDMRRVVHVLEYGVHRLGEKLQREVSVTFEEKKQLP